MDCKQYFPAADLSWSDVHGELVIIDARTGEYHVLNEVGQLIWLAISEEEATTLQVLEKIQKEFNINKKEAEIDLKNFVDNLTKGGLLNCLSS